MIYIAIPTYDGKVHWTTMRGVAATARLCGEKKIGIVVDVIPGDAFVGKARNLLAHRFLKSGAKDMLFVDADVGFDPQGVIDVCRAEPEIVMGLYRMKCEGPVRYPALLLDPPERHPSDPNLIRLQYGPAGFLRIRREVFDAMRAKWPDEYYVNAGAEHLYDYFPAGRTGNNFTGEDMSFCNRAAQCGFKLWAMQNVKLEHYGEGKWASEWAIDVMDIDEARRAA